ncbi:MAG: methyltransferase type 11 [Chloroflexota bacterium]
MEQEEYAIMYREEKRHWWYRGMADITRSLLSSRYPSAAYLRILDAGCGTGGALTFLKDFGHVVGIDQMCLALEYAQRRRQEGEHHAPLAQASVTALPFADASFDLVTSFDVLYHLGVADDDAALAEFHRVLRPGGRLLLRLPAHEWLRGQHDAAVHTRHRYTRKEIAAKLARCGLVPETLSYANAWLLPLVAVKRLRERRPNAQRISDLASDPPRFNRVLHTILRSEAPFIRSIGLPLGSSIVALARKPTAGLQAD